MWPAFKVIQEARFLSAFLQNLEGLFFFPIFFVDRRHTSAVSLCPIVEFAKALASLRFTGFLSGRMRKECFF